MWVYILVSITYCLYSCGNENCISSVGNLVRLFFLKKKEMFKCSVSFFEFLALPKNLWCVLGLPVMTQWRVECPKQEAFVSPISEGQEFWGKAAADLTVRCTLVDGSNEDWTFFKDFFMWKSDSQRKGETSLSWGGLFPGWSQRPGMGRMKPGARNLTWVSCPCFADTFPKPLAGSWVGRGTAGAQAGAQAGAHKACWHQRQWFPWLCHNADPRIGNNRKYALHLSVVCEDHFFPVVIT